MAKKKAAESAADTKSTFGEKGRMKVKSNVEDAIINVSDGEHIIATLSVTGGIPEFAFSCRHRGLWAAGDFEGHPKQRYQWVHFKRFGDADHADDTYVLTLLFAGVAAPNALTYNYVLEHCNSLSVPIARLKDIEYSSTNPNDFFHDGIRLFAR